MSTKVLNGLDMQNTPIDNLPAAVSANQPATKAQLDAAVQGFKWKDQVRAASTASVTLSGTQTIDGVSLIAGDRFLAKDQSTPATNGIYIVAAWAWSRATDADASAEIGGMAMFVQEGTTNGNKQFVCTTDGTITLGTTGLAFSQVGAGTTYSQGTGISIVGSVVNVDTTVVARKAGANIGDGSATSFNVTHSLGTTDAIVLVRETSGSKQLVNADVVFTDSNTVTVSFATAPTAGQYRVTVIG